MTLRSLKLVYTLLFTLTFVACHDIEFDSKRWKNYSEIDQHEPMRWDMVDDLINNYQIEDRDTLAVFDMLGRTALIHTVNGDIAYYSLGPCRSGISYGTLEVTFKDNKVVNIHKRCN